MVEATDAVVADFAVGDFGSSGEEAGHAGSLVVEFCGFEDFEGQITTVFRAVSVLNQVLFEWILVQISFVQFLFCPLIYQVLFFFFDHNVQLIAMFRTLKLFWLDSCIAAHHIQDKNVGNSANEGVRVHNYSP